MLSHIPAYARSTPELAPTDAKLTEAHGDVYKRAFIDWTKEALGDPSPASVGEILHEGMQIGTGEKSWAQVQWRHMSARAWANSVYAIAPNQRLVYLVSGEMLYQLDKNRKEKSPYFVWTNLLQARIRGTTVLFQATKTVSRITVLEGTVEVLNKIDRSVVTLSPGVVYEVSSKADKTDSPTDVTNSLTNISLNTSKPVPIFETSKTVSTASALDPAVALHHPLLSEFESPLSSLPLITDALSGIQSRLENVGKNLASAITDILHDGLTITTVPRALSYSIGPELQRIAQIKVGSFDFFQPEGVIGATVNTVGSVPGALTSVPSTLLNTASTIPQPNLAQPVTSLVSPSSAAGLVNTTAGLVNTTIGATSTLTTQTILSPVTNTVNTTVNTLLPGASGLTNTVTGTVTTAVGGTLNTVNSTLTNTLTGLGGLLGH